MFGSTAAAAFDRSPGDAGAGDAELLGLSDEQRAVVLAPPSAADALFADEAAARLSIRDWISVLALAVPNVAVVPVDPVFNNDQSDIAASFDMMTPPVSANMVHSLEQRAQKHSRHDQPGNPLLQSRTVRRKS